MSTHFHFHYSQIDFNVTEKTRVYSMTFGCQNSLPWMTWIKYDEWQRLDFRHFVAVSPMGLAYIEIGNKLISISWKYISEKWIFFYFGKDCIYQKMENGNGNAYNVGYNRNTYTRLLNYTEFYICLFPSRKCSIFIWN